MRRAWKFLLVLLVLVLVLLVVNAATTGSETKPAGVTAEGGQIMELDSVDLQVVDSPATGPGPEGAPIVLLHCYSCSLHWWDEFVPLINQNHRVIRFDLIGFGGSQKPGSGYSIDDQARAVSQALNELGVEAAVVVGHSMGGEVATAIAQNSSQLVDRVAVIGTPDSVADDGSLPFLARLTYTPLIGEAIWRLKPDSSVKSSYESAFAPGFDYESAFTDPDQVVADADAMTYTSYKEAAQESEDFTDQATISARITDAAVPFLAILGAEDQIVDSDAVAEAYGTVPGAEVRVLDGVGHSAQLEAPADTAELLLRFAGAAPKPVEPEPEPKPKPENSGKKGGKKAGKKAGGKAGAGKRQGSGKQGSAQKKGGKKNGNRKGGG